MEDFLGDPPPNPRFLASLGTLSLMELDHCSVVDPLNGWSWRSSVEGKRGFRGHEETLCNKTNSGVELIVAVDRSICNLYGPMDVYVTFGCCLRMVFLLDSISPQNPLGSSRYV